MSSTKLQQNPRKPFKLEIANELYKFAFQVNRQKFSERYQDRSPEEIDRITKNYFRNLKGPK